MRRVFLSLGSLVIVVGLLKLTPVIVAGQGQTQAKPTPTSAPAKPAPATAPAKTAAAAKPQASLTTLWGEPDLQGIWVNDNETPLQRPAQYKDREFFTDKEIAAIDAQRA